MAVAVLIPGTGVVCTASSSVGGGRRRARRWVGRALGAFLIAFAARLALTDR